MTNPYNAFNNEPQDPFGLDEQPRPQSYAEYQDELMNPRPNPQPQAQQPYDPFAQNPQASVPSPYAQPGMVQPQGEPKSWVVTLLLTAFLGNWGAHNFYLGYRNRAIAQLTMTLIGWLTSIIFIGFVLLGTVAIWAFVDFIRVLLRSGEYGYDASGRFLT